MQLWIQAVQGVGFPIAVALILLLQFDRRHKSICRAINDMTIAIATLSERESRLYVLIDERVSKR